MVADVLRNKMIHMNTWKDELMRCGKIVQDGDNSHPPEEAECSFDRYVELVNSVSGSEGVDVAKALIESMQVRHDYGAYQSTFSALWKFPEQILASAVALTLPDLIRRQPDWAGDLVNQIAQMTSNPHSKLIKMFNLKVHELEPELKERVVRFIRKEEVDGWLDGRTGILTP
jgi:hypothetical protein